MICSPFDGDGVPLIIKPPYFEYDFIKITYFYSQPRPCNLSNLWQVIHNTQMTPNGYIASYRLFGSGYSSDYSMSDIMPSKTLRHNSSKQLMTQSASIKEEAPHMRIMMMIQDLLAHNFYHLTKLWENLM